MQITKHLQNTQPSYIREILSAACSPNVISLAGGLPDGDHFPISLMESALRKLPEQAELFQYGSTEGYAPLREFFHSSFALPNHHSTMVTTGSQQGLDLIARAFIDIGEHVVMEAPSYLGALQVFSLARAKIHSVPQTETGPNLEALEKCFASKPIKLFYAVPDFHNPTGVCWDLNTRKAVAELCKRYEVLLLEDAPYRELRFNGSALPMVSSFCPDHALVLRSYSKIATPGIRVGVVSGREDWLNALVKLKQSADLHSSIPMQSVLLSLIQNEKFDQHLEQLRNFYRQRYETLRDALNEFPLEDAHFNPIHGGMFVWLTLSNCNTDALAKKALDNGIAVVPSSVFYCQDYQGGNALRLNFTNASNDELREAIQRLQKVSLECQLEAPRQKQAASF